ncbi:baeRF12 domain-containing protein [Parerythrobacter jejuensis]|uniref:Attachment protein n=1 Tax=Parerythrobacter jejuensis TaxID=795812 RepID=A0A845AQB9_9SPHN|nr:host attachment protein [Parerythrobacter jejuensis]MXP30696.1 attachment protein [Parerythrobacter jejuensis]MXP33456.1 attachment protein [Parerythrobacter jejuensis]
MKCPHNAHVAIVDGERFILMQNTGKPFEPKLTVIEEPVLDPSNFSAGVRHQDDVGQKLGRTQLDELAHGAAVAEWLNGKAIEGDLEDILIVADPKSLGEMRNHYHAELERRLIGELDKTVTSESLEQIAKIIANA